MTDRHEIEVKVDRVNPERLAEELVGLGLPGYAGVSTGPGWVRVFLTAELAAADRSRLLGAIQMHDPRNKSRRQRAEETRRAEVDRLRKPWKDWTDRDKDALLRLLAEELGVFPDTEGDG